MDDITITRLEGPDRVRKRPAVVFGSNDTEGAWYAVKCLLKLFVTEAQLGHCKQLKVKQTGDDLEISGDDRGIYLGQDTGADTVWKSIFCQLDPASAYPVESGEDPMDATDVAHHILYGDRPADADSTWNLELYATTCACAYMELQVDRDGVNSTLRFRQGQNEGGIYRQPTTAQNGTCFRFALDPAVFTQTQLPESLFTELLESFAMLVPGLSCSYENETHGETVFYYPEGAKTYIEEKNPGSVYRSKMWAKGKERYNGAEYKAHVELAVGHTPNAGELQCFHNFAALPYGGTHLEQLQERLCSAFNHCLGSDMTFGEMGKHLTLVIATRCAPSFTVWKNGSRQAIANRLITDMAQDIIDDGFDRYLQEFKAVYQGLWDAVKRERKAK